MLNKKIIAWSLYDLANTAFTSPFATIFWPLLLTSVLGGNEFHLGLTVAIAIFVFSILIPIIGTISDKTNIRKPFIVIPTLAMILIIIVLPYTNLFWNLVLAGIAIVFYNISLSIYNALLPTLASEEEMGKISGIGMATGFAGTILSILVAYFTLRYFATDTIETVAGIKAVFPSVALFFLVFSLPLLFIIKDEKVKRTKIFYRKEFLQFFSAVKSIFRIKGMFNFLAYFALFSNALAAIDIFFYLYAKNEIGLSLVNFMFLFMAQASGACVGAVLFGKLSDSHGAKNMLKICTALWIFVMITFIISKAPFVFWVAGLAGSIAFGGSLASSRTIFVFLAPKDKMGEFFGYSQIVSRLAAIFGPLIGGFLIVKVNYNSTLLMVMGFLVLSFLFLEKTPDLRFKKNFM